MSFNCPECNREYANNNRGIIICDNDCGTIYCLCGIEFYQNNDQQIIKGHNLTCGNDNEIKNDSETIITCHKSLV
jgi:hypothetical protein